MSNSTNVNEQTYNWEIKRAIAIPLPQWIWFNNTGAVYFQSLQNHWWQIHTYDRMGFIGRPLDVAPDGPLERHLTLAPAISEACAAIEVYEQQQQQKAESDKAAE